MGERMEFWDDIKGLEFEDEIVFKNKIDARHKLVQKAKIWANYKIPN